MLTQSNIYIYALVDPRDDQIKYIGQTTKGDERYKRRVSEYYLRESTLKNNWIKSLKNKKLLPKFEILEFCNKEELDELEIFYISYFKFLGFKLLNHNDGGVGIRKGETKESVKRTISEKLTKHNIIDLETGEIFKSIYDVRCKYPNITYSELKGCLESRRPSCKKKFFAYLTKNLNPENELNNRKNRKKGKRKNV